jgi:predicted phage terminase large subunit-like protein
VKVPDFLRERLEAAQQRLDAIHAAREEAAVRMLPDDAVRAQGEDAELCRRHLLDFILKTWQRPTEPFLVGVHTRGVCQVIDEAIDEYRAGRSSFHVIVLPFRHGKSDIVSRYLPPKFLAEFKDRDVLLATYGQDLASDLSRFARNLMGSAEYAAIFPGVEVSRESSAADRWGIQGENAGGMAAVGLGGAMTGRGYALGIVDDFLKSREEAESQTVRDTRWQAFISDFLTRRAPVSITLVIGTRWSTDDPIGRIEKAMGQDEKFPAFKFLKFPALSDDYPSGTLFPERFGKEWYESQKAALGSYGFAGLMQGEPIVRGGNMFRIDNIDIVEAEAVPKDLRWVRCWDLASTMKQVGKRDPDFTVGVLMAVERRKKVMGKADQHVWVWHMARGQWDAPQRDKVIQAVAEADGPGVRIVLEQAGGYKDTVTRLEEMFRGKRTVLKYTPVGDKVVRCEPLLAAVEGKCFHILKAEWNGALIEEMAVWPYGAHDDQEDAIAVGLAVSSGPKEIMGVFRFLRELEQGF